LRAYSNLYLEEEIRAEAVVRNLGTFSRFLEMAASESGGIFSFRGMARELGLSHPTVAGYFEILEDCLLVERIDPITHTPGRKRLTKSPRYLFFDLGVRRAAAEESRDLPARWMGPLFEQFVGLELIRQARLSDVPRQVRFWRDPGGPEVDWVVCRDDRYLPIECKWTDTPTKGDARHLRTFLLEHPGTTTALVVCQTPRRVRLEPGIEAIPWTELAGILEEFP
jgi:predicted AAA+ superfamily ATPase